MLGLKKRSNPVLVLILICLLLSACGSSPEELAATSAVTKTPTQTPIPPPTLTPVPTQPFRVVKESLIAQVDLSTWIKDSTIVSSDFRRIAYCKSERPL